MNPNLSFFEAKVPIVIQIKHMKCNLLIYIFIFRVASQTYIYSEEKSEQIISDQLRHLRRSKELKHVKILIFKIGQNYDENLLLNNVESRYFNKRDTS